MIDLTDYNDFFIFLGGLLIIGGIIYLFFHRFSQSIFISEQEISKLRISNIDKISSSKQVNSESLRNQALLKIVSTILLVIIIGGFLFNQFLIWKMDSSSILNKLLNISITITKK